MLVVKTTLAGPVAKQGQAIAAGIESPRALVRLGKMQDVAILGGEQKQEPVHQAQQLLKENLVGELAVTERLAQKLVVRMTNKAVSQFTQGLFHAIAQLFQGALTLLGGLLAPLL